jgi:tRNA A-37 threonylcarbamoyl transferase component Bud32
MTYKHKHTSRRAASRRKITFKQLMAQAKATLKKATPKKSPARPKRSSKKAVSRHKAGVKKLTSKAKTKPKKASTRKTKVANKKAVARAKRTPQKAALRRKTGAKKVVRKVKARPKKNPARAKHAPKKRAARGGLKSRRKAVPQKTASKVKARPKKTPARAKHAPKKRAARGGLKSRRKAVPQKTASKVKARLKKSPARARRTPKGVARKRPAARKIAHKVKAGPKKPVTRKAKAAHKKLPARALGTPPKAIIRRKVRAKTGQKKASLKSLKKAAKTIPTPKAAAQKNTMDNYQIVSVIAQGGMGKIFKAIDIRSKKVVIMKQLIIADKEVLVKRFKREADIMLSLNHKNIVSVYDYLKKGSSYFIIMEFVDGVSLEDLIKKRGMIEPLTALLIFNEVCQGLKYAHDRKIIHRDIKPNNVLVAKTGAVKLMDFGIAKSLQEDDEGLTKTGVVMGTPAYMSPEQLISTKYVDSLTDIYSMGVMFYQMVTGKRPYSADFTAENLHKISIGDYVHPRQLNPDLPEYCVYIVKKAMHHKKEKRVQDLKELIDHMSRYLAQFRTQSQINNAIKKALANL